MITQIAAKFASYAILPAINCGGSNHRPLMNIAAAAFQNEVSRHDGPVRCVPLRDKTFFTRLHIATLAAISFATLSPVSAGQTRGGGFTVQVTVSPGRAGASSQFQAGQTTRQYDSRGLPILSQDERNRLRASTPPPTVSIHY